MVVAPVAFPRLSVAVDVLVAATALEVVSRVKHPVVPIAKNGNCAFMAGSRSLTHLNAAPQCPVARRQTPVQHRKLHHGIQRPQRLVVSDMLLRLRRQNMAQHRVGGDVGHGTLSIGARNLKGSLASCSVEDFPHMGLADFGQWHIARAPGVRSQRPRAARPTDGRIAWADRHGQAIRRSAAWDRHWLRHYPRRRWRPGFQRGLPSFGFRLSRTKTIPPPGMARFLVDPMNRIKHKPLQGDFTTPATSYITGSKPRHRPAIRRFLSRISEVRSIAMKSSRRAHCE